MATRITHHACSLSSTLTGELDEGIACFRGIPYATVTKRWTHSTPLSKLPSAFSATEYGPRCSQGEGMVLVTGGVTDPTPGDDEFKCLNLNIAVPTENGEIKSEGLPVMVWIHGGAFNYGANSVSRYLPTKLALLAQAQGNPIIIVSIQYRLGPLGFGFSSDLASSEPKSSEPKSSEPNSTDGNFGFVDQIHALEWVRDHISSFGGNPRNLTAFGVSAGSASIHHHILSGSPLFDRAILMSGSAPTLGPLPVDLYERAWSTFMKKSGISRACKTATERIEMARNISAEELIANFTSAPMGPMADGVLLPENWDWKAEQKETRCKEIIIGDTKIEAIIMDGLIAAVPHKRLLEILKDHSSIVPDTDGFLRAFGINIKDKGDMQGDAYRDTMRCFLSVGMFQYPAMLVARTFPGKVYFYHFDEPSPFPGPTLGLPYHGQCALFVYQNSVADAPEEARKTAEAMGKIWTSFAAKREDFEPWEEMKLKGRFMRLGPMGQLSLRNWEKGGDVDGGREYSWLPWVEHNFDSVKDLTRVLTIRVD